MKGAAGAAVGQAVDVVASYHPVRRFREGWSMRWAVLAAALLAASWGMACSGAQGGTEDAPDSGPTASETFCADAMACEGGNQADTSACVVQLGSDRTLAAVTGCTSEYDTYLSCNIEQSSCVTAHYSAGQACQVAADNYDACVSAATEPATTPSASDGISAYCTARCECEHCSNLEYARCLVEEQSSLDVAAAYGCSGEELVQCVLTNGQCVNDHYSSGTMCDSLFDALWDCTNAASSLG
jgi:hypothetical protein